jgi:hypothetical protein
VNKQIHIVVGHIRISLCGEKYFIAARQERCRPNLRGYSMRYPLSGGKRLEGKRLNYLGG